MKSTVLALWCFCATAFILASPATDAVAQQAANEPVYTTAEKQPEFPGGKAALSRFLAENIQFPGSLMRKKYNTGPVAAKFIIDKLGYVHDIRVTIKPVDKKSPKGMQEFMSNIIAAIEKMPRWDPGQVNGRPVAVFYTLPIEVTVDQSVSR